MKTYRCESPEIYCRIGRALVRFDFKDGLYKTDNPLFQRAIENSPHYKEGRVTGVPQVSATAAGRDLFND